MEHSQLKNKANKTEDPKDIKKQHIESIKNNAIMWLD